MSAKPIHLEREMITQILVALAIAFGVIAAPVSQVNDDEREWSEFHADSYAEHAQAFEDLFNSYTYKLSKNGRSMVNGKFVKAA